MSREKFNRMNKAVIHWEETLEGMQGLSDEYEESGWRTLVLHPGDVTTTGTESDRRAGFRLIVPDSELDALAEMVGEEESAYDEFEVHRAPADDLRLFVVVVKATGREEAILFPIYYEPGVDREFVEMAREQETIYTDITNLDQSRLFSFDHENPTLFLP